MHCFCTNAHIYSCEHVFIQTFIIRACSRSFVCTLMYSCTCSVFFVRSLLHSSDGLLVCSLLFRAFVGPLVCSLFHSCIRKLIRWCVRELVRFYVLLFVRWFIRAITRFLCIRSFVGALVRMLFYFSCRCSVARLHRGQRPLLFFLSWYEWFNHLSQALCFLHFFYSYARKASPTYEPYRRLVKVIDYSFSLFLKTLEKTQNKTNQNRKKNLRCTSIVKLWSVTVLVFVVVVFYILLKK